MKKRLWSAAVGLGALTVLGSALPRASAQAVGNDYPYQGRAGYALDATVNQVDPDRDRVIVYGDDGQTYTLDTYHAAIKLRSTDRAGQTGDLVPGMRLHITGNRAASDLIEAESVSVLPYRSARPTAPVDDSTGAYQTGRHVTLRGTVESVDNPRGSFVLRINDHTRRVFVSDNTELSDLSYGGGNDLPLHSGDRVSVAGTFKDDGTVQATLVTPRRLDGSETDPEPPSFPVPRGSRDDHQTLTGRITQESNYFSRDIKVRLNPDEEVTVHVPKNISIRSDGRDVSVHDLHKDELVRVYGHDVGDSFQAERIQVTGGGD